MLDKLPFKLTAGVTATREGLVVMEWMLAAVQRDTPLNCRELKTNTDIMTNSRYWLISWPDAAERLRYRDGEPWCVDSERDNGLVCDTTTSAYHGSPSYLHRLAAILCDDGEAFRLLHWCVTNLGQEVEG